MLFTLLALVAALQTQTPTHPEVVRVALTPPPAVAPARPAAPPLAEVEPEVAAAPPPPRTRQVCRYVEVTGQRFAQRRCRTVVIDD